MDEQELKSRIGATIRARRIEMGFSQETFADEIGMHRAYYGSIERGVRNLTLPTLSKVARGLKTKPSEILRKAGL